MYLTISSLTHYLISRDLVPPASILDGDLMMVESRRRNRNFQVLRSRNPSLFVKQPTAFIPDMTLGMAREAVCYQLAAEDADFAEFRDIMPRMFDYNAANHTLVTELLSGSQNLNEYHELMVSPPENIGQLQGRMLGRCHACSLPMVTSLDRYKLFPRMRPFVLSIWQNAESVMPNMSGGVRGIVATLRQEPEVMQQLGRLWADWQQSALIHGDTKWDNILILQNGTEPPALRFIDWELADIGDPAWDVAGIFTSYLQRWLLSLGTPAGMPEEMAARGQSLYAAWPALRAFWVEYARTMRFTAAQAHYQLLRCVSFMAARFVHLAFELLQSSAQFSVGAGLILKVGREALLNPQRAQMELLGLVSGPELMCAVQPSNPDFYKATPPTSQFQQRAQSPRSRVDADPTAEDFSPALRDRLLSLSERLAFISTSGFQFDGQPPVYFQNLERTAGNQGGGQALAGGRMDELDSRLRQMVEALWPVLYAECYMRDRTVHGGHNGNGHVSVKNQGIPAGGDSVFMAQLSAANQSHPSLDRSWQIYQIDANSAVHVTKGDNCRVALPGEYAFTGGFGRLPMIGEKVDLLILREGPKLQPGFYFAFGESLWSTFDDAQISRIYFNARAEQVAGLLESISRSFNRYRVPFRFKCLDTRVAYEQGRADSAILYVAKRHLAPALELLREECFEALEKLNPETPLFSKKLMPGLSAADDPGTGESFGQSRMRLVSLALIYAQFTGRNDHPIRLQAIGAEFRRKGISPRTPHLGSGNKDLYQWLN